MLLMALLLFFILFAVPSCAIVTNNLDQALVPQEPDTGIKCESCPCVNPCALLPPPPPPPPKSSYCPPLPPPPPRFIYVTGVPGNFYVTDSYDNWNFYSAATQNAVAKLLLLAGFGALLFVII